MLRWLKCGLLELRGHHLRLNGSVVGGHRSIVIIVIIIHVLASLSIEISWTLVFAGTSIL
jgi:hypothetical protein